MSQPETRQPETRQKHDGLYKRCRCVPRAWAKCPHGWQLAFQWRGVHHRISLDRLLGTHVDSKTKAESEADRIRTEIRAGTFGQPTPRQDMTLRQLADLYLERYVMVTCPTTAQAFRWAFNTICATPIPRVVGDPAPFGTWRLADIVTDTIERFREARRARGTGVVGTNRHLGTVRAMYNWGIRAGYVDRTPFKRQTEVVVKLAEEPSRSRRLNPDLEEEDRLLAICGPHLRAVVEAAIQTGMRRGEILSLQWRQVAGMRVETIVGAAPVVTWAPRAEIVLDAAKTKTRTERRIPISTRLRAILEMRRCDPDGDPFGPEAFVFGNEIGQRVRDVGRAWETAVLKSHGIAPKFTRTCNLTPESRAALAAIDLHFHDLRREAGSRWLEGGVPLHTVRDWLGHTSIAQTSTYLAGTMQTQHDAMTAFEARVQVCASNSRTGGRKSPQSAEARDRKPNKTAGRRDSTPM